MTTLKINLAFLFLLFACCLNAQVYHHGDYNWENPDALIPPGISETEEKTFVSSRDLITSTEAIYKTLYQGDFRGIKPYLAGKMKWNDKEDYTFPEENPSLAELFDTLIPDWADWRLYDLTYQELPNNVITVSGRYRVLYHDCQREAPFIQVWKWTAGQVIEFQHYVGTQVIAKR